MNKIIDTRELAEELATLHETDEEVLDDEDRERLEELESLAEEITEFYNGETLIHEDSWKQYVQQYAEETGAVPNDLQWPLYCIDWEYAASELEHDYVTVVYDSETYFVRA
jgi:hypothetical protein